MAMESHRLVVPRTARYVTMGSTDAELDDVWFVCHGYGQLAEEFLGFARALEHPRRLVVAPEALSRFYHEDHQRIGASWMTREDREREMEDYIRYLDLLHEQLFDVVDRASVRLWLLGYSQGAATATRWAARGRAEIDRLVLWGSLVPPEFDDPASFERIRGMRLTLVGGTRDEFLTKDLWEKQRARLKRHDVPFEELSFEGGHRLDDDTLRMLAG